MLFEDAQKAVGPLSILKSAREDLVEASRTASGSSAGAFGALRRASDDAVPRSSAARADACASRRAAAAVAVRSSPSDDECRLPVAECSRRRRVLSSACCAPPPPGRLLLLLLLGRRRREARPDAARRRGAPLGRKREEAARSRRFSLGGAPAVLVVFVRLAPRPSAAPSPGVRAGPARLVAPAGAQGGGSSGRFLGRAGSRGSLIDAARSGRVAAVASFCAVVATGDAPRAPAATADAAPVLRPAAREAAALRRRVDQPPILLRYRPSRSRPLVA